MSSAQYEVILSDPANRYYQRVDRKMARRLNQCFAVLEKNPFDFEHHDIKCLHGQYEGLLRFRVGDLRVIYEVDSSARIVYVHAIQPRGRAY